MSNKFIQLVKVENKIKELFKVEIADKDQSLYIHFLTQNQVVKYQITQYNIQANEENNQFIEAKPTEYIIEKPSNLKISYHYSGKVHLQEYHNNEKKRNPIKKDLAAINLSKLDDKLNHIATVSVNNIDFLPDIDNKFQGKTECLEFDFDKFVIVVFASKRRYYEHELKRLNEQYEKYICFSDFKVKINNPNDLIYYYFAIRPKINKPLENLVEKIESDLNFYLGWDENIRNTSIDNKMLFVQTIN